MRNMYCHEVQKTRTDELREKKSYSFAEVISVDIDTMPVTSIDGFRYRVDIVDHATSWVWSGSVMKKNDCDEILK